MPSASDDDPIRAIADRIQAFAKARDWERFHTPKNLAMSVAIEAAELMEVFQWHDPGLDEVTDDERARAAEELADVMNYSIHLADRLGIDIVEALHAKMDRNEERYPAAEWKGKAYADDDGPTGSEG